MPLQLWVVTALAVPQGYRLSHPPRRNPRDRTLLRPGGVLLVAFHVDSPEFATGEVNHLRTWFGQHVHLEGHFLDPRTLVGELAAAGFRPLASLDREPIPEVEYPSRRAYLLVSRR